MSIVDTGTGSNDYTRSTIGNGSASGVLSGLALLRRFFVLMICGCPAAVVLSNVECVWAPARVL